MAMNYRQLNLEERGVLAVLRLLGLIGRNPRGPNQTLEWMECEGDGMLTTELETILPPPQTDAGQSASRVHHPGDRALRWIAGYNLAKRLLLLTLALGLLGFLHRDVDVIAGRWLASLGVSLENVHVVALLACLDLVTDHQLRVLSSVTFLLGGVFVTEGIGLFFKQRWAEYLTIIVTASFVPLELFESLKHFGTAKLVLLAVNVTIVCCLLWILKKNPKTKSHARHLH